MHPCAADPGAPFPDRIVRPAGNVLFAGLVRTMADAIVRAGTAPCRRKLRIDAELPAFNA
jgi:hypothetical protein